MTNTITSKEAFFELIESAEQARNADILQRAHDATATDRQLDEEIDWRSLIVSESVRLAARIDFLGRHPRLPRFLGGCAIGVNRIEHVRDRRIDYISDPVMATQAEYLGDYAIRNYFQFEVDHYENYNDKAISLLKIFGVSEEINSEHQKKDELYRITANPTEHRTFWKIEGAEFGTYRVQKQHEIGEEFKRENPWLSRFMVIRPDGGWEVHRDFNAKTHEDNNLAYAQERKIKEELIPQLDPGPGSWQYPAELYHFPLGLLIQANEVFGTKQR